MMIYRVPSEEEGHTKPFPFAPSMEDRKQHPNCILANAATRDSFRMDTTFYANRAASKPPKSGSMSQILHKNLAV